MQGASRPPARSDDCVECHFFDAAVTNVAKACCSHQALPTHSAGRASRCGHDGPSSGGAAAGHVTRGDRHDCWVRVQHLWGCGRGEQAAPAIGQGLDRGGARVGAAPLLGAVAPGGAPGGGGAGGAAGADGGLVGGRSGRQGQQARLLNRIQGVMRKRTALQPAAVLLQYIKSSTPNRLRQPPWI